MKFELKNHITKAVALALCGTAFVANVQAAGVLMSNGLTSATIDDAGYFHAGSAIGLNFAGREFVNVDIRASNWSLNVNGASFAIGDETTGLNPLSTTVTSLAGGKISLVTNIGDPTVGWTLTETFSIPTTSATSGHVVVSATLTNNTGADAKNVQWGVGLDPDQGRTATPDLGNGTTNEIIGLGNAAGVRATTADGWSVTLANTTSASATALAAYIDEPSSIPFSGSCCAPIDPGVILAAGQALNYSVFGDYSINLGFDLGAIANGKSATFGYEYILAVPEPETYAMLLAGLGLIGFSARRRIGA